MFLTQLPLLSVGRQGWFTLVDKEVCNFLGCNRSWIVSPAALQMDTPTVPLTPMFSFLGPSAHTAFIVGNIVNV